MNELNRNEMEKTIKELVDNQEFLESAMKLLAELLYAKLDAMVKAGFSRQEALDIIKIRGFNA